MYQSVGELLTSQSMAYWKSPDNVTVYPAYLLWKPFRLPRVTNSNNKSVSGCVLQQT